MSTTLSELLNSTDPPELVDPIELTQEDMVGKKKEIVSTCLLGIFNPMGPTLVAINLVSEEGKPSVAVLHTSLNPFSQTRLLIARAPSDPESVCEILKSSYQVGDELILGGWPTLVLPVTQIPAIQAALHQMLLGLLRAVPPDGPVSKVSKVLSELKAHQGDPWGRIPSFEEMALGALGGEESGGEETPITEEEFGEWISIMGEQEHVTSEFKAIIDAWGLSIQNLGPGLPHMPAEEMAAEMSALGYSFFK